MKNSNKSKSYLLTGFNFNSKSNLSSFSNRMFSKAELKNKKLVKTLNSKMFKGYNQIKNSKTFKPINDSINLPTIQWLKSNLMPFNEMYNLNYKHKHFASSRSPNLNQFFNIEVMNNSINQTRNNVFLTTNNKSNGQLSFSSSENKLFTLPDKEIKNNAFLLKRLFPDENELEKISSLHFLSLEKHPYDYNSSKQILSKAEKIEKTKYNEIEFLYKISHPLKVPKTQNNFYSRKCRINNRNQDPNEMNKKEQKDKDKLQLNITVMSYKKPKVLTPEERRLNYIHNNLDAIRALPKDTFKDYINNLFDDTNNEENNYDNKQFNIKEIQFNPELEREKEQKRMNYIKKQPQLIKYKVFQKSLDQRGEKYNELRKMAFELQDNEKNKGDKMQKSKNDYLYFIALDLISNINPRSHLLTESKYTYKKYYDKQSKMRDVKIAWGLRNEFTQGDIRRLLNGKELLDSKLQETNQ